MDLPCAGWMKQAEQKWRGMGSAERQRFTLLNDIDEIFIFAHGKVLQEDLEALSRFSERYPVNKSSAYAASCREQGNFRYKEKDYASAALYYSKGVCFAEKNTEQLSLCYANRSAALFHLGHYSECLKDIQQAFDEGYPGHLQHKLSDRQKQCMSRLKGLEQLKAPSSKLQPVPTGERQDRNTCLSAGVSVHFTVDKGRHLLATEKKLAGEVVLEDKAFSFVLIPAEGCCTKPSKASVFGTEHRYCHHCLCQTIRCVPCLGCSYAQYCSPRCGREAWAQYHCWECPLGSELLVQGVLAHLALRVTLKAGLKEVQRARESQFSPVNDVPVVAGVSCGASNVKSVYCGANCLEDSLSEMSIGELRMSNSCSECSDYSYLGIYSLLPHMANHSPSLRFLLAFTMAAICQRLKEVELSPETQLYFEQQPGIACWGTEQSVLGATALRHMMQLRCNAQAVTAIRVKEESSLAVQSSGEIRIATTIFPILSLLNHSCFPNTSISFSLGHSSGVTVTVRTCKDISAGQELLHCYGPHCSRMPVRDRQRLLLEQYFFHCHCKACELELMDVTRKQELNYSGLKCEKCGSTVQTSIGVHVCSQSSCTHQISHEDVERTIQMLQYRLDQALELTENSKVDRALRILKEAATQADSILMKTHPIQGELADAIARAYATIGDWRQAASHLKCSVAAVSSHYGDNSVELGRQLFKLAQLHFNGGDKQSALSVIPIARRLLSLHCDPYSEELQELQDMEACLHRAM